MQEYRLELLKAVTGAGKIEPIDSLRLYEKYRVAVVVLAVLLLLMFRNVFILKANNNILSAQLESSKKLNISMEKELCNLLVRQTAIEKKVEEALKEVTE